MSLTDFASQQGVSIKEQEPASRGIAIHAPVKIWLRSWRHLYDNVLVSLSKVGERVTAPIHDEVWPHLRTGLDASVFVVRESTLRCYSPPLTVALDLHVVATPLGATSALQEDAQLSLIPAMRLPTPARFNYIEDGHRKAARSETLGTGIAF
jgi:hypothetical protein